MEKKTIQGTAVPVLGFGTWQLNGNECTESVEDAIALGYRHVDTAQMYENEAEVGKGINNSGVERSELFLTTKISRDNHSASRVRSSVEDSLRKLKTDYVDLLLIHWPNEDVPLEETLNAFFKLKEEGKIKHAGVSNFPTHLIDKALETSPIFCDQVEYHPLIDQEPILKKVRENDMLLTAYSPIARGKVKDIDVIKAIAEKHDKSPIQVALRWLIQQDNVIAIPKAAKHEHRKANMNIFDFELTDEEMEEIFEIEYNKRLISPSWAPVWD